MIARFPAGVVAPALAMAVLGACASKVPPIAKAVATEAHCGAGQLRPTAVASVMTSTDDKILPERPTGEGARREVRGAGGAILRWNGQPLKLDRTSAALGETDGYARVREAAVPFVPEGATTRKIYLRVRDHGFDRWIAMTAFDVQDICVEGRRQP
ncbi:MAG: hypothetical protein GIW95_03380 [Candidatus Eremiobacteraeota bacterium]|nr:hypothetical protein [Candidatus Eremiobacteraeota bacterium]